MVLPVTDSRSSLHNSFADRKLSPLPMSSSLWPMNFVPQLLGLLHPRKPKYRTTFIGLVFFVFMTTYVFLVHGSALSPGPLRYADSPAADQLAIALESMQNSRANVEDSESVPLNIHRQLDPHRAGSRHRQHQVPVPVPVLKLTPEEELAAVSSFIASLPQNVIPPDVDPSLPIDPQLVLDFDTTRGSRAADEVRVMVEDVWTRNPVFVYSRVCIIVDTILVLKLTYLSSTHQHPVSSRPSWPTSTSTHLQLSLTLIRAMMLTSSGRYLHG